MLFNSTEYLFLFLPVVLLVFVILGRGTQKESQLIWLIFASLFFYAVWQPIYLLLIVSSIVVNFLVGSKLAAGVGRQRKVWLILGIVFNLSLLAYFKYTGFFLDTLNSFWQWMIPVPEVVLPLAISFFTFQQIAYLVDVSRGECQEYQFRHYALFVLFFPQLIAGPIVHHKEMMPQFMAPPPKPALAENFAVGITFIAIGLFKKVVLADSLALVADPVFSAADQGVVVNSIDAWLAMLAFSFQIYFDFSGYSDMAIGSARLFGIKLPENFRSPYKSTSIIEIWRRWHMTLSRFLRDYLYFSFGGNRFGVFRRYRNLILTMLLGGLWHGAAWTFVIWGGLHGLYLCINHGWRSVIARFEMQSFFSLTVFQPVYLLITFFAWSLAFVVFRATDVTSAWAIIAPIVFGYVGNAPGLLDGVFSHSPLMKLLSSYGLILPAYLAISAVIALAAMVCWLLPNTQQFLRGSDPVIVPLNDPLGPGIFSWRASLGYAIAISIMICVSVLSMSSVSRFIYFQF